MTHQFCSAVENNASIPSFWQYSSTKLYYSNSRVNLPLYSLLNQEDLYDYSLMLPVRLAQYLEQIKRFFFFFLKCLFELNTIWSRERSRNNNYTEFYQYHIIFQYLITPVFLPGKSSWTEEPGGLQSMGHKELDITERLTTHSIKKKKKSLTFSFKATLRFPELQHFH